MIIFIKKNLVLLLREMLTLYEETGNALGTLVNETNLCNQFLKSQKNFVFNLKLSFLVSITSVTGVSVNMIKI